MNDYTDEIEDLKVIQAYGDIPRQYPLGINGFSNTTPDFTFKDSGETPDPNFKASDQELSQFTQNMPQQFMQSSQVNQPTTKFGKNVQDFFNVLTPQIQQIAPFFKRNPKQKVFIKKEQDYTTYAVIGGAVIVAAVLAIAVRKSGRRKE